MLFGLGDVVTELENAERTLWKWLLDAVLTCLHRVPKLRKIIIWEDVSPRLNFPVSSGSLEYWPEYTQTKAGFAELGVELLWEASFQPPMFCENWD